ncbi:MAG: chaperone modulator CbpM [Gammaproteobacteria bacterium]|nr:chaperone modulator CbpM [Gammaproteobacteria bacterium]MCF6363614.1 chaperone modulator CbpM [Gammaproteobacteria bacterium]
MSTQLTILAGVLLDENTELSLKDLSRACSVERRVLVEMVQEGLLEPVDVHLAPWRFQGDALHRARTALRLRRDLEVNFAGIAMILDLLDEIDGLETRLRRLEGRFE